MYFTLVKFVLLLTVKGSKLKTCYCVAARESVCNFFFVCAAALCCGQRWAVTRNALL